MVIVWSCDFAVEVVADLQLPVGWLSSFEDHPTRYASANFDAFNDAVADGIQRGKDPLDLFADREVTQVLLCPWLLVAIELHVEEDLRLRPKHGFTIMHFETTNGSEA
jgi:hypothetical protein